MIRYRTKDIPSHKVANFASKNIPRLGKIESISGIRFKSTRKGIYNDREVVVVKGEHGSARFFGVLWGYFGEGPTALIQLLVTCGLSKDLSEHIAHRMPRNEVAGTEWQYNVSNMELISNWNVVKQIKSKFPANYNRPHLAIAI